jgi:hypothetical protein
MKESCEEIYSPLNCLFIDVLRGTSERTHRWSVETMIRRLAHILVRMNHSRTAPQC